MTYKELLRLYKEGKLNEQQRQQIEQDIQRQDAINEYLYEEGDIPGLEDTVFRQLSLELNPVLKEQQMNLKVTFRKSLPPRSRELSGKHSLNWG